MGTWINRFWGPNVNDVRRLLMLDKARVYTIADTREQLQSKDTDVTIIPGDISEIRILLH